MVSKRMKKQIDKRIKWIEAEADEFKVGTISKELYETGGESSNLSHFSAALIPFKKAKSEIEQILFMQIPIKSEHTDIVHLAQPFSHAFLNLHDHPIQLSCITSGKIPCTLLGISEGFIREFKYVSELEENDPLIPLLEQDSEFKELRESAFVWKQYLDESEQFHQKLKWGFQIAPLNENELIFTINTGTELEGIFKKKRKYDLNLRLLVLEALVKNVHHLGYNGKIVKSELYAPVYEILRRELYPANATHAAVPEQQSRFCPNCGAQLAEGVRFCSGCGERMK